MPNNKSASLLTVIVIAVSQSLSSSPILDLGEQNKVNTIACNKCTIVIKQ